MRIEQQGSRLIDDTRKERLQVFADKLVRFLRTKNGEVTSSTASKYLRQDPAFAAAMRNVPSFGAFIKLFDALELVTSDASGGVQ